ncbi:MAG: uroporphyrinogen decarboxylase [Actinomycetota bacterium]
MSASAFNDRFLRACRREPVDRTPVWFMRQAGRYLPEYRELRGDRDILDAVRQPDLAVEVTLQPLRRFDADAAILFSDIMVPLAAIGIGVRIDAGRGPVVAEPFRSSADVGRLRPLQPEVDVPHVLEAVRLLRKELTVPLIGFAGAPFTLAAYLIEGGPSRTHDRTRALIRTDPAAWRGLMDGLADLTVAYLTAQVEAGAQAIQVFDSWVGSVGLDEYLAHVQPVMRGVFDRLAALGVPTIHFGVGTGELLRAMRDAGGDVIGVDWRVPLDAAWERVGADRGVQGNLDPVALLAPWNVAAEEARRVLSRAAGRDGHVFNLGHGVLPDTPVEHLQRLVDLVHTETERSAP